MPVFISASPNPVPISMWSMSQQGTTTVSWDVGAGAFVTGSVFVSVDSGPSVPVKDAAGDPVTGVTGSTKQRVEFGKKYLFQLKKSTDLAVILASVTVETRELLGVPSSFLDDVRKRGPLLQGITNVRVFPGIESVRIMFRTRQATVPVIDIKRSDNQALAGAAFPFLQGPGTAHDYAFPLAQNTDFTFHVTAAPGANALSTAKSVATSGQFRTGSRNAQVFFDHVAVHTDGDPGSLGDGDFTFDMGAGDIDSGDMLGATQLVADISGGDDRAIHHVITIDAAPVGLWVQVRAKEDDSVFTPFGADPEVIFAPEGSTWTTYESTYGEGEFATVTKWFDLSGADVVPQEVPFTLETGPKHIDFSLFGRLRIQASPGAVLQPMVRKSFKTMTRARTVAMMMAGDRVSVAGRTSHVLQLTPDGGLYRADAGARAAEGAGSRDAHWTQVPSELRPPLTVVAAGDALHLLAVDDAGRVLHQVLSADAAQAGSGYAKARSVGGSVMAPVVAACAGDRVELFALDKEGAVFHKALSDDAKGEWKRIGEGMAGSLNAFTSARGEIGVVARARDGEAMHLPWSLEAARAGSPAWRSLGKAPPGALSAEGIDDVVVLAVLGDDETVHAAPWRTWPELPSKLEWKSFGTMNDLISARYSLLPRA